MSELNWKPSEFASKLKRRAKSMYGNKANKYTMPRSRRVMYRMTLEECEEVVFKTMMREFCNALKVVHDKTIQTIDRLDREYECEERYIRIRLGRLIECKDNDNE